MTLTHLDTCQECGSGWEGLVGEQQWDSAENSMGRLARHEVKDIRFRFWKTLSRSARLAQSGFPAGHHTLCFTYTAYNTRIKPRGLIASFGILVNAADTGNRPKVPLRPHRRLPTSCRLASGTLPSGFQKTFFSRCNISHYHDLYLAQRETWKRE